MKNYVVVEILEVGTKGLTPVELKGFSLLRSVYAAGAIAQGHEETQEGSIIKRAGLTKEGKSPFEMEEGDLSYGVTMDIEEKAKEVMSEEDFKIYSKLVIEPIPSIEQANLLVKYKLLNPKYICPTEEPA